MSNTDTVRALFASINDRDPDAAAAHIAESAEWTEVPTGQSYRGPGGWRENMDFWLGAFPDGRVEVTTVIDGGEWVAVEYTGRGTNTGPLPTPAGEIPPTGKPVEMAFVDVLRFEGGKVAAGRSYFDMASMMNQLGITG
jgi:ketosteroid isomerase-like protein